MKPVQVLFEWVLTSAFLILAVTVLRALLGKRVGAGLRYGLWAVVLVRLLVPVQLFTTPVIGTSVMRETGVEQFAAPPPVEFTPAPAQSFALPEPTELPDGVIISYQPAPANVTVKVEPLPVLQVLGWLWLAGSLAMTAAFIVSNLKFARRLRRVRAPLDGVDRPLPAYIAGGLPSPCLFGLARPAVYVTPEAADDPAMLRHVLAHEYTHFRHGDHIWNILRSIALAVHWWNPLVWLAVVLSRRDCELACDEGALKRLGDGERVAYGRTLLALLTEKPRPGDLLTCATTMTGGQKSVFDRVTRIARAPKRWLWAAVVAVLAAALACVCAFGAAEPERLDGPGPDSEASHEPVMTVSPGPDPEVSHEPVTTASPAPTEPVQVSAVGEGMDFEFHVAGQGETLRFTNLTQAVTSSKEITFSVVQYAILDMDRDGETELVLELKGQGGYIILYRLEDGLYGYHEVPRGLEGLKADGTYEISSGAGDWGYNIVSALTTSGMEGASFTWCESAWEGLTFVEELFFVDGVPATQQEFEAASDAQRRKEDAPWRPWVGSPGYPPEVKDWLDAAGVVWLEPAEVPTATKVQAGDYNWKITYHGKEARFSAGKDLYGGDVPAPKLMDVNGDGKEEIVLVLEEVVNGVSTDQLYLFDAETLIQYDTSKTAAMVRRQLSTSCDDTYYYISAPDFGFDRAVPRGLAADMEDKTRDYLELYTPVFFPVFLDEGRLACVISTPVGQIYGYLGLDGWNVICTGFSFEEYQREPTYADVLLWGVPFFFFDEDGHTEFVGAADIPSLFNDDPYTKAWEFALVDLDQDGTDELVLQVYGAAGDAGGYLVLYRQWGGISGFKSGWRTFWDLKTDGTFQWDMGLDRGCGCYPSLYSGELWELSRMHSYWGEPDATFSIGGESVTQEEYWKYDQQQNAKEDAVWYEFTRENLEAVLLP